MDTVFEHLRRAIDAMIADGRSASDVERFAERFCGDEPQAGEAREFALNFPARLVLSTIEFVLRSQSFDVGKGADGSRGLLRAALSKDYTTKPRWLEQVESLRQEWPLKITVNAQMFGSGKLWLTMTPFLPGWIQQFHQEVRILLSAIPPGDVERERLAASALSGTSTGDKILPPGEPLDGPYSGTLRDYSACATRDQVDDLLTRHGGVMPLGRWAFVHPQRGIDLGPPLYLSPIKHGNRAVLREHQGALLCAPQNAGKTDLLVRWAQAANRKGYNLLIVDVKGNMIGKLQDSYAWQGELFHVTTDPQVTPGDDSAPACHAFNVLEGIDPRSRLSLQRVRQLAEALLPSEGLDQGEARVWRSNWLNWLSAFIHLILLEQFYYPLDAGHPDLGHVYELATDEDRLTECLENIETAERENRNDGCAPVEPGLSTWFRDISVLVSPEVTIKQPGRKPLRGARAEYTYNWLTEQVAAALRAFRPHGLLHDKVSGRSGVPKFVLERLAGLDTDLKPSNDQVTVVLATREQELDDAQTLLTLAIVKLQHALYERMRHAGRAKLKPVLLLLDETRRIRNFKPNEYVSYARESEAGCVVVYQSLDQIGTDRQIRELLANIGTQIYLGSLTSSTARHFIERLPTRDRSSFSISTAGADGTAGLQISKQQIPYFSTADLYVLPAGNFPAIVYLKDQPARVPILVTLDRTHTMTT